MVGPAQWEARPLAPAPIVNRPLFRSHAHLRPKVRQMVSSPRSEHRGQTSRIEREEPNRAAFIRANDISAHICFWKMKNPTEIVNLKKNQPDPCCAIASVEHQTGRQKRLDQGGLVRPMQESQTPPGLRHRHAHDRLRRRWCYRPYFSPACRSRLRQEIRRAEHRRAPLQISPCLGSS